MADLTPEKMQYVLYPHLQSCSSSTLTEKEVKRTVISSHLVPFDAHFMHVWIGCVIHSVFMLNRQINGLKVQNNQTLNTATQEAGTFKYLTIHS